MGVLPARKIAAFFGSLFRYATCSPEVLPSKTALSVYRQFLSRLNKEVDSAYQNTSRTGDCPSDGRRTSGAGVGADPGSRGSGAGGSGAGGSGASARARRPGCTGVALTG